MLQEAVWLGLILDLALLPLTACRGGVDMQVAVEVAWAQLLEFSRVRRDRLQRKIYQNVKTCGHTQQLKTYT